MAAKHSWLGRVVELGLFLIAFGVAMLLVWQTSAQGGDWTYREGAGKNELLCRDLLKRLNRYARDGKCSLPVIASYPKFTAPPWAELDPKMYEELLVKLEKYGDGGPSYYFHLLPGLKERQPESVYRYRAKRFIEQGGRLRMWRTRLVKHYGTGPIVPAPSGEQTVVQMYIPIPKENQDTYCVGKPKPTQANALALIYIVAADLGGLDPNVDPGTYGILGGHDLVIYEGKPLLIGSESIWRDGELMLDRLCNFEFVS